MEEVIPLKVVKKNILILLLSVGFFILVATCCLELGTATCKVLALNGDSYEDLNNYSIVIKLTFGSISFFFNSDVEDVSENEMLDKCYNLKAD